MTDIHSEKFVKSLFDEMSQTYGIVNILSSLGFAYFWRRKAVRALSPATNAIGDFMAGGAECLTHIHKYLGASVSVDLVDWSAQMCEKAGGTISRSSLSDCSVLNCSALKIPVTDGKYDAIVSTFGLKILNHGEINEFAKEIKRVLKPSGEFSILEFSIPKNAFIRFFFTVYVKYYVPFFRMGFSWKSRQLPNALALYRGIR